MATEAEYEEKLVCPVCKRPMDTKEFQEAEKILGKMQSEKFLQRTKQHEEDHQTELEEQKKRDAQQHQNELEVQKKIDEQEQNKLKELVAKMEKDNENVDQFKQTQLAEVQAITAKFDKEMAEKDSQLQESKISLARAEITADDLKKQLVHSPSELRGAAGEFELRTIIKNAFEDTDDIISKQNIGKAEADVVQHISANGNILETPICYDYKRAESITKKDITKAKNYRKIYHTKWVIIVSWNLSKTYVPNGYIGKREGIMLVHPTVLEEFAKTIRENIIEISMNSKSKEDMESKQAKLYKYILSHDFSNLIGTVTVIKEKMSALLTEEEKKHQSWWKNRKTLQEQLTQVHKDLSDEINGVTQDSSITKSAKKKKPKPKKKSKNS